MPPSASASANQVTTEDGVFVTIHEPKNVLVDQVPSPCVCKAVDAAGDESVLQVLHYGTRVMLYAQTPWLKAAKYPVRFEVRAVTDPSFCTLV